ncbi:MAG: hypothetical protein ABIG44_14620 [Planctomycetota bacterium]
MYSPEPECETLWCDQSPCHRAAEYVIAEAAEVSSRCPRRLAWTGSGQHFEQAFNGLEYHLTPRAAAIAAAWPRGGTPRHLRELLASGRLVLLHTAFRLVPFYGGDAAPSTEEPELAPPPDVRREEAWVKVELVDEEGNPLADEAYRIQLPDRSVREGRLDERGRVEFDEITPGMCQISFPELNQPRASQSQATGGA